MTPDEDKPKVCYIMPTYSADASTHFAYLASFVREISKNFDVFLIIERGRTPSVEEIGNNVRCHAIRSRNAILRAIELKWAIIGARFKGYKDFYVHYSFYSAFIASIVVRFVGGRVFYWNCGEPWKYQRPLLRELFERITYKLITYLVTGTEGMKNAYAEHYQLAREKIKVMPNWIDIQAVINHQSSVIGDNLRDQMHISKNAKIILFAHRLSTRKGARYLPEIISAFKDEDVIFIIAGDGPESENLKLKFSSHQFQDKVRMLGWIPREKVMEYMGIADIFIMPSEEEGFPHVLLEAMAYGVPYVAFDVGGVKEITPPGSFSFIINAGDIKNFIKKTELILFLDSKKISEIGEEEKEFIKKYDISTVATIFRNIITKPL